MKDQFIIYGLTDPRTDTVRYVGKSCTGLKRPRLHAQRRGLLESNYKARWVRSLLANSLMYGVVVLYASSTREGLAEAEQFWIAELRSRGFPLTNTSRGGEGGTEGCSLETRKKIAATLRGKKHDPARVAKMAASKTGVKLSPPSDQARERMREAQSSRPPISDETRQRMSQAAKGKPKGPWKSEESRARMSVVAKEREARRRAARESA